MHWVLLLTALLGVVNVSWPADQHLSTLQAFKAKGTMEKYNRVKKEEVGAEPAHENEVRFVSMEVLHAGCIAGRAWPSVSEPKPLQRI